MKVTINTNGRIDNFYDDGHIFNNPSLVKEVKGVAEGLEIKTGSAADERFLFPYYLDDKGIVQMLKIEEQPEFKIYQANQRAMAYEKTDAIKLKADELKLRGDDAAAQEMYTQWLAAKDEVRAKFPYGA